MDGARRAVASERAGGPGFDRRVREIAGPSSSLPLQRKIHRDPCLGTTGSARVRSQMNSPNSSDSSPRVRVALVSGASRGIGRAIGERLAADGYHAVLTYRADGAGAEAAVAAIRAAGGSAEAVKADVTSAADIAALADRLDKEHEGVDVLVNNAAVLKNGLFALMPEASWNLVIDTALGGTARVTKAVMRGMLRRRWGRIVNISSLAAFSGSAGQTNYSCL